MMCPTRYSFDSKLQWQPPGGHELVSGFALITAIKYLISFNASYVERTDVKTRLIQ